jgi:hypothetical protein
MGYTFWRRAVKIGRKAVLDKIKAKTPPDNKGLTRTGEPWEPITRTISPPPMW